MMTLKTRLNFTILFRVGFLLAIVMSGLYFGRGTLSQSLNTILICAFSFSAVSWGLTFRNRFINPVAWAQIVWDMCFTTSLVFITGNLHSPFIILYVIYTTIASALFFSRGAVLGAILSATALVSMALYHFGGQVFLDPHLSWKVFFYSSTLLLFGMGLALHVKDQEKLEKNLEETSSQLIELSQVYWAIVNHINSGIIFLNPDGTVKFLNPAAKDILDENLEGVKLETTIYKPLLSVMKRNETKIKLKDSLKIIGHYRKTLPDQSSVIVFQDLTEYREMEKKVWINKRLASVGQLAAGVAHEIRNPLASLSGSIQMLRDEISDHPESKKLMEIVLRETERLDTLAGDFLQYAKPSALRLEDIKVADLFNEVISLVRNSNDFKEKEIKISVNVSSDLECRCDMKQVKQVMWNLIKNASQAVSRGGSIEVSAQKAQHDDKEFILFSVSDDGEGIDQESRGQIFDPFFTTKDTGSGLGLSLVHQSVKAHEGRVWVESNKGKGTVFYFELLREGSIGNFAKQSSSVA